MKSKKLFAILTLVAFMMTLVPVAAFGVAGTFDTANRFATIVSTDKTSLTADGSSTVKFTTYVYDADNDIAGANVYVYMTSKRGVATDLFTDASGNALTTIGALGSQNNVYWALTDATGKAEFKVKSSIVGTAGIAVGLVKGVGNGTTTADDLYAYVTGISTATPDTCGFVKTTDITFTAASLAAVTVLGTPVASDATVVNGNGLLDTTPYVSATNTINGNGVDTYEITFKVSTANGSPVSNQEVTFSVNKSEAVLNKTTATTDAAGVVKVKVNATKPGTYSVKATAGDQSKTVWCKFDSNQAYDIQLISTDNQTVAKSNDFTLKFKLMDSNGNQVDAVAPVGNTGAAASPLNGNLIVEATTRPTDSVMDSVITNSGTNTDYYFDKTVEGYLSMKILATEMATEGAYVIKAYLPNGKTAVVNFTIKKQETITKITVAYDQATVALQAVVGSPTVKRWDANNVSSTVSLASGDVTFTTSDVRMYSGGANATFATNGNFTATNNKDYAGEYTVTAIDKAKNLTASTVIAIAKQANGFTLTPADATTAVGTDATVNAQWVDVDGKALAIADVPAAGIDYTFYTISKPEGALITTSQPSTRNDDLKKYGKAALKVSSNKPGEVKIQVVGTIAAGSASAGTYTKEVTLNFGAAAAPAIGAKSVTLFIGASGYVQDGAAKVSDVAPFIQDGRTFVAVRPLAEAFGATAGWNEATQTVTLTRSDMTLTIVIGKNTITKVAGGVTTTITADVAAFIKDGRTVLPFRAVGEAFGATVNYDAATQAVSFVQ